jgi:hypothetical protein
MAKYEIRNAQNEVVNVIEWDGVSPFDPGEGLTLVLYTPPPATPPEPDPVPQSVTPWQAREALRLNGLLSAVNAHIDGLGDAHAAYVAWHYAERIRRNSPFVETLAPTFGLSEAQLDALFTQAASLSL